MLGGKRIGFCFGTRHEQQHATVRVRKLRFVLVLDEVQPLGDARMFEGIDIVLGGIEAQGLIELKRALYLERRFAESLGSIFNAHHVQSFPESFCGSLPAVTSSSCSS